MPEQTISFVARLGPCWLGFYARVLANGQWKVDGTASTHLRYRMQIVRTIGVSIIALGSKTREPRC